MSYTQFRSTPSRPEDRDGIMDRLIQERRSADWSRFLASLAGLDRLPSSPDLVQERRSSLIRSLGAGDGCQRRRGDRRA